MGWASGSQGSVSQAFLLGGSGGGPPARCPPVRSSPIAAGPRIAGTPYRLTADATLASRIGRPSPPGAPARGRDVRSFRSRIRDAPVDTVHKERTPRWPCS
jgi:hypothetical protein